MTTILGGAAGILVSLLTTYAICRYQLNMTGEPLQWPLAQVLLISGFIAGFWMAARTKRVAFKESLGVVAILAIAHLIFRQQLSELSTYGTAAAYFAAVMLAGYLTLILALSLGGSLGYILLGNGRLELSSRYERFIGRRFLMAKRGSRAVSLITWISILAVTVACAGMVIVMSVMNGFSTDLRTKILGANAHLMVMRYGKDFTEYPKVMQETLQVRGVVGASPFILNEVMVSSEINLSGAVIKGIDVDTIDSVSTLTINVVEGSLDDLKNPEHIKRPRRVKNIQDALEKASADESTQAVILPGIVIGQEMAHALRTQVGDIVNVVSPVGELGPSGPVPKAKAFRVAAIFFCGMYEYDAKFAYIELNDAQQFFAMKGSVTGIEYKLSDIDSTQRVARSIDKMLGGYPYYTKDWMQMNRNLFSALKLEKIAMFIILMALLLMASLLILVALIMVVIEKGKEIAILKSMGATDTSIMKIFVTYGLSIGGLGALIGLGTGCLLCVAIQSLGIGLDPEVYYITHIPVRIDPVEIGLVTLGALVISFLATIPPALFAARLKPVDGLRYE